MVIVKIELMFWLSIIGLRPLPWQHLIKRQAYIVPILTLTPQYFYFPSVKFFHSLPHHGNDCA